MFRKIIAPRISETNAARHIGHSAIPVWLEEGYVEIIKLFGRDPASDPAMAMANLNVDFLGEIFFGADVEITTGVVKLGTSSLVLHQEIHQNGRLCARAVTTFVHFDYAAKKSRPIPPAVALKLREHMMAA